MTYLILKYAHIISAIVLFGTGLGSAFYKWMADRNGNIQHIAINTEVKSCRLTCCARAGADGDIFIFRQCGNN